MKTVFKRGMSLLLALMTVVSLLLVMPMEAEAAAKKYTITYKANAGSSKVSNMPGKGTKTHGKTYTLSKNIPTRSGYLFKKWSTDENHTFLFDTAYDPGDTYKKNNNLTLYAQWEQGYTVRYNANGGTGSMSDSTFLRNDSYTLKNNSFTRDGYVFTGWNTKSDGSGTSYSNKASVKNLAAKGSTITLYAQWTNTYKVFYVHNGTDAFGQEVSGTMTPSAFLLNQTYNLSANRYARSHTNIRGQKTTYVFMGWNTKQDGTGTFYPDKAAVMNLASKPNVTVQLYAQWAESDNVFTVKYDKNGGTGSMDNSIIRRDTSTSLRKNAFTRSGYTFEKWTTASNGTGSSYTDGQSVKNIAGGGATITLYAKWKSNTGKYTVTFNPNGGSGGPGTQTKIHGQALSLSSTVPTRTGYTFLGWSVNKNASTAEYAKGKSHSYTIDDNLTLYAIWKINTYTITFNANGGSGAPGTQTKIHGQTLAISSTVPTRTGYTFLGWSTDQKATTAQYAKDGSYTTDSSKTLYAVWKPNTYTITFNANGGSGGPGTQTKTHGQTLTLSSTVPTRSGYIFLGWSTNQKATTAQYIKSGSYSTDGNKTLYAVWQKNPNQTVVIPNVASSQKTPTSYVPPAKTYADVEAIVMDYWNTVTDYGKNIVYWNKHLRAKNITRTEPFLNTITGTPCAHPHGCTSNGFWYSDNYLEAQCEGFSYYMAWVVFGKLHTDVYTKIDRTALPVDYEIKPGDILRAPPGWKSGSATHSMFVYKVEGGKAYYIECNYPGGCQIYNARSLDVKEMVRVIRNSSGAYVLSSRAVPSVKTYNIHFDANKPSGAKNPTGTMADQKAYLGGATTLTANAFKIEGYVFDGWNTKKDGKGTAIKDKGSVTDLTTTENATVTLYAQWKAQDQVKYPTNVEIVLNNKYSGYNVYENCYSDSKKLTDTQISAGTHGIATKIVKNNSDNYWYYVTISGITGWVPASHCDVVDLAPGAVTLSKKTNLDREKNNGTGLDMVDILTANSCTITQITGAFRDSAGSAKNNLNGVKQEAVVTGNYTSFNVKTGSNKALNNSSCLTPRKMPVGLYYYTLDVSAKANVVDGNTMKEETFTGIRVLSDAFESYSSSASSLKITLDATDGSCPQNEILVYSGKAIGTLPEAVRVGYRFLGWYTEKTGGTKVTESTTFTKAATIYARWEIIDSKVSNEITGDYDIVYNSNTTDTVKNMPANEKKKKDADYTLSKKIPERVGYLFDNWNTSKDPLMNWLDYTPGDSYKKNEDLTLYAQWEEGYAVYYDKNGGTGSMEPSTFERGKKVNLAKNTFTRDKYVFLRWNTKADGSGNSYSDSAEVKNLANKGSSITLYAQWTNTYQVQYHYNVSWLEQGQISGDMKPSFFEMDKDYNLAPNPYTRVNENLIAKDVTYVFLGWNTKADGTGTFYEDQAKVRNLASQPGKTVNLYAQWAEKDEVFTVVYNKNGGTGTMKDSVIALDAGTPLRKNTFTRSGYTFEKWTTGSGGTGSSYTDGASVRNLTRGGGVITLYAQWKSNAKVYTVQYVANGGTGTMQNSSHTVGVASNLNSNGFTRPGYVFKGWNTKADGSDKQFGEKAEVLNLATTDKAVVKLYAQWREETEEEYLKNCTLYPSYMNLTVTNGSGKIMVLPVAGGTAVRQLSAGEQMVSTGLYKNSKSEYWYRVRANRDGKVGYVFAGDASSRGIADRSVNFGVWLNKNSIDRGYACDILGSVSARYNILYKVTGVLDDSDPKTEAQTQTITSGFADIKGTDLNKKLAFATLNRGKGALKLQAMLRSAYSTDGKTLLWEEYTTNEHSLDFRIIGIYNVLFEKNTTDDVKNMPNTQNKTDETDLQLPSNVLTRTGYTFLGWAKKKDAKEPDYWPSEYLKEDTDTGNLTLYAVWDGPNEYTITFDTNGGTGGPGTATAIHGKPFYYPANIPAWEGCTFLGWSKTQDVDGNAEDAEDYLLKHPVQFTEDTTLYAVWKHGTVTITYYHNDGTGQTTAESILASKAHTLLGTDWITRDGYILLGYADTAGATEPVYLPGSEITIGANKILHLVWKPEIWTVTYNANGGTGAPKAQEKWKNVDLVLSSQIPVRMNDQFLGWSDSADSKDVRYKPGDTYTANADITLYAVWEATMGARTFTVTYDANGGVGAPAPQTKYEGVDLQVSQQWPTREGYYCMGWATTPNAVMPNVGGLYTEDRDVTFYAVWREDSSTAVTCTVTFDANGGQGGLDKAEVTQGEKLMLWTNVPSREGYEFLGWAESADADTPTHWVGNAYTIDTDLTLYAVWQRVYTVTFDANGGFGSCEPMPKYKNIPVELPYDMVRDGYVFMGWAKSPDATTPDYFQGDTFDEDADITLYAVWEEDDNTDITYTVTFDANGGYHEPEPQTKIHGVDLLLSDIEPRREGKQFIGWAHDPNADMPSVSNYYRTDEDVTLYAVWWDLGGYNVFYEANGGEGGMDWDMIQSEPYIITTDVPTRDGYLFAGWSENENAETPQYFSNDVFEEKRDLTLYAVWEENVDGLETYEIIFDVGDRVLGPGRAVKIQGRAMSLPALIPEKAHYRFLGWARNANAAQPDFSVTGDWIYDEDEAATLYAVWERITFTVTYEQVEGTGYPDNQIKYSGEPLTLSTVVPVQEGYIFLEWQCVSGGYVLEYQPGDTYTEDTDLILRPRWDRAAAD